MKEGEIELEVPSSYENLSMIRSVARSFLVSEKIEDSSKAQIIFALDELATNVVEHAYSGVESDEDVIRITMCMEKDIIRLTVEDFGIGLQNKPSKDEGGMGLRLVKKISDEFELIKKDNGVRIEIIKK